MIVILLSSKTYQNDSGPFLNKSINLKDKENERGERTGDVNSNLKGGKPVVRHWQNPPTKMPAKRDAHENEASSPLRTMERTRRPSTAKGSGEAQRKK